MKKSTLLEIISSFSNNEIRDFGEFVKSPFFNKNQGVIKLYDYIRKEYPEFSENDFEKEYIFHKIFPDADYNEGFMKATIFNLTRLAEEFLAYSNYENDTGSREIHLIKELRKRNFDNLLEKKIKLTEDALNKIKYKDADYYNKKYELETLKQRYNVSRQRFLNVKDIPEENTYNETDYLLKFFFINILDEYRFLFNQKMIVKFDFRLKFLNELIEYMKNHHLLYQSPLITLHFYELLLLKEFDPSYYYKIKELFIKEKDNFTWNVKYSTLSILANFAMDQYYKGKEGFLNERFEIHNLILENKLYSSTEGGYFKENDFNNMVTVGIQLKEYDWVTDFIEKYKDSLLPEVKNNLYFLSHAKVCFVKKKYDDSMSYLSKLNSLNRTIFKTNVKNLTLMNYYELGLIDQAMDLIDSYRHFLSNDKIMPELQLERNLNFMKFCKELLKLKFKFNIPELNELRDELAKTHKVMERNWLIEKTEEFQ